MKTALGRIVKAWLVPGSTSLLLLALVLGVLLLYGGPLAWRVGRAWLALTLVAYLLLATPAVAHLLLSSLQASAGSLADPADARGARVLVVLGNGAVGYRQDGWVVHYLLRRTAFCVLEAIRLHALMRPELILVSGGPPPERPGDLPEAEVMRRELVLHGVTEGTVVTEGTSRNTSEQADNVAALLRRRGVTRVVLVTTPGHVERATQLLARHGLEVIPSVPLALKYGQADDSWGRFVPSIAALRGSESAMYEYLALVQERWRGRRGSSVALLAGILAVSVGTARAAVTEPQTPPGVGVVRGTVVDAESGQPLANVAVRVSDGNRETRTDATGVFGLAGLPAGPHTLVVSLVNYVLVRREVTIAPGTPLTLTIPLTPGVGAYTEQVEVVARAAPSERAVPASHRLDARDLLDLRGVAADDPFRAMQALPAVAATDDFHAEFAVRGSAPGNIGVVLDGVQSPMLVHTVRAVSESGSVALINSDVLERATLLAGSYPQRYGNRTGAQLELAMRDGSRERTQIRGAVSGTGITFLAEGPVAAGRGSWLASFRKSYIDWLAQYVAPDIGATFGFADGQGKVAFDVRPDQRLEFTLVSGRSHAHDRDEDTAPSPNGFEDGFQHATLATAAWRLARPRWSLAERIAFATATYRNVNDWGDPIAEGTDRRASSRTDASIVLTPVVTLDAGIEASWPDASRAWQTYLANPAGAPVLVEAIPLDESGDEQAAFVQATVQAGNAWVVGGVRADRASPVGGVATSPWAQVEWPLFAGLTLRGGGGIFRQTPDLEQAGLLLPGLTAARQRAAHGDLSLEGSVGRHARWTAAAFVRDEKDMLRAYGTEYYLAGSVVARPSDIPLYANALSGRARGFEVTLSRRDANRLSGWVSYAFGQLRYTDRLTGESFDADFDQRHAVNAYIRLGLSARTSVSTRARVGSNFPIVGYWEERDGLYYVGSLRNRVRLPTYARVDVRANRTFFVNRSRLTLFAEVLNVLARENWRQADPSVDRRTRKATGLLEELFPVLPSVGLLVEF